GSKGPNAPAVFCWQRMNGVKAAQSVSDVHGAAGLRGAPTLVAQKPQKTFDWPGKSCAVAVTAPVVSAKAIGRSPMCVDGAGRPSRLVGCWSPGFESPGVQVAPLDGPPLHVFVIGLQIGQGWMNVTHVPPAPHSLSMRQP